MLLFQLGMNSQKKYKEDMLASQTLIKKYSVFNAIMHLDKFVLTVIFLFLTTSILSHGEIIGEDKNIHNQITYSLKEDLIIKNEKELRNNFDKIVFLVGKVIYDYDIKNPTSSLKTMYGEIYECPGIKEYKGKTVLLVSVPMQFKMPGKNDTDYRNIQTDKTDGQEYIILKYSRIISVIDTLNVKP